ncbi:MAG: hypothetical protein AAFP04_00745 [Myxococcota bacterium]
MKTAIRVLGTIGIIASVACTGGVISKNGDAIDGANVSIWTCDSIGDFTTTTDAGGVYQFNPYLPNSPDLDQTQLIPAGPIAINITSSEGSFVERRQHVYDETCPAQYDGSTQDLPCKIQSVDIVPMTLIEFFAAQAAFFEEDCGLSTASEIDGRPVGEIVSDSEFDFQAAP